MRLILLIDMGGGRYGGARTYGVGPFGTSTGRLRIGPLGNDKEGTIIDCNSAALEDLIIELWSIFAGNPAEEDERLTSEQEIERCPHRVAHFKKIIHNKVECFSLDIISGYKTSILT
jgi:hypothetical protein